jgi:GH25 family lysozyme M1 (1,4-beta-N-acetylmuramidase)
MAVISAVAVRLLNWRRLRDDDQREGLFMLHGVDVSSYQPDWAPAANDSFVFVKATEGTSYRNGRAAAQLAAGRAKRLQIGHYHYMRPDNAAKQAAYFVAHADIRPGDLLVCDWENTRDGHPSDADAAIFIAEVKKRRPKNKVGLYCNASDWNNTAVKAGDFLWIAHYGVKKPSIHATWDFWQYADKSSRGANIDQNKSRFNTLDELKAWANRAPLASTAQPKPTHYSGRYQSEYVGLNGGWVTPIDREILLRCASAVEWHTLRLSQGGLSNAVRASAKTHYGLGVGDIALDGRPKAKVWKLCAALIRSGIVAFPRGFIADSFQNNRHIHFASVESYSHAHPQLQAQINEYKRGGDGLVGNRHYTGPKVPLGRWKDSPYNPANIKEDNGIYCVNVSPGSVLYGLDVDRNKIKTREVGFEIQAAKRIKRWGRWNVVTASSTYYDLKFLSNKKPV